MSAASATVRLSITFIYRQQQQQPCRHEILHVFQRNTRCSSTFAHRARLRPGNAMSHTQLPRVTKIVVCLIFTKFKKLEPIFIIFDTLCRRSKLLNACIISHSFSCDLRLPGNTLTTEYARCIPYWVHKNCTTFRSFF